MQTLGAARVFIYKEIKSATNHSKQAIGHGNLSCEHVGKFPDGKSVAVKIWFDKTQLGVDPFTSEVE